MVNGVKVSISGIESVVESGTRICDIIEQNLKHKNDDSPIVAVLSNGLLLSMFDKVKTDSKCTPVHLNTSIGFDIFRRTLSFVLSAVCHSFFPDRKLEVIVSCSSGISYKLSGPRLSDEEWETITRTMKNIMTCKDGKNTIIETQNVFIDKACSYFKSTQRQEVSDLIDQKRTSLFRHNKVKLSTIDISAHLPETFTTENTKYSTLFIDPMLYILSEENSKYFGNYKIMREKEHGEYSCLFENYFIIALPDKTFKCNMEKKYSEHILEEEGEGKAEVESLRSFNLDEAFYNIIPSHLHKSLIKYYKMTLPYRNNYLSELNRAIHKLNQANLEFAVGKMNNGAYKLTNEDYPNNDPNDRSFSFVHYAELFIRQQINDICSLITEKTRLILICGPSSSGKTTFSHRLAEAISVHSKYPKIPVVLGMDMYYKDQNDCPILKEVLLEDGTTKISRDFEHPEALKIDLINEHLKDLVEGKEIRMPFFDFSKGISYEGEGKKVKLLGISNNVENDDMNSNEKSYPLPPSGCIIMEGIHGLNPSFSSSVPEDEKLMIFIHPHTLLKIDPITPFRSTYDRLIRRSVRDARSRGYSIATTVSRWPSVRDGEISHIFGTSKNGNYIFNSIHEEELPALAGVYDAAVEPKTEITYDEDEELGSVYSSLSTYMSYITRMSATAMKNEIPSDSILREFIGGLLFGEPH